MLQINYSTPPDVLSTIWSILPAVFLPKSSLSPILPTAYFVPSAVFLSESSVLAILPNIYFVLPNIVSILDFVLLPKFSVLTILSTA